VAAETCGLVVNHICRNVSQRLAALWSQFDRFAGFRSNKCFEPGRSTRNPENLVSVLKELAANIRINFVAKLCLDDFFGARTIFQPPDQFCHFGNPDQSREIGNVRPANGENFPVPTGIVIGDAFQDRFRHRQPFRQEIRLAAMGGREIRRGIRQYIAYVVESRVTFIFRRLEGNEVFQVLLKVLAVGPIAQHRRDCKSLIVTN
jgi:hypothetical protein